MSPPIKKMKAQDPLNEVNLRDKTNKKPTYISKFLNRDLRGNIIALLHEYKDCFAWDYDEMLGLSKDLSQNKIEETMNLIFCMGQSCHKA